MIIHSPYISGSLELENPISGSLTDAPADGTTYGRKDGAWIAIVLGAALMSSAWTTLENFAHTIDNSTEISISRDWTDI